MCPSAPAARRILPEIEHEPKASGKVFSASGSDIDDLEDFGDSEEILDEEENEESEVADEFTQEEE